MKVGTGYVAEAWENILEECVTLYKEIKELEKMYLSPKEEIYNALKTKMKGIMVTMKKRKLEKKGVGKVTVMKTVRKVINYEAYLIDRGITMTEAEKEKYTEEKVSEVFRVYPAK